MRQPRPEEGSLLTPESPTTITWHILGAGAIGSLWAIYGHRAGADVRLILRDQQTLDAYQQCAGISLHISEQTLHYQLPASCPSSLPSPIQHLLITTKAQQTLPALKTLSTHIADDAVLLLLQNGLGIAEQIQHEFPKATVIQGSTTEGCYRQNRFEFVHAGRGQTFIGSTKDGEHDTLPQLAHSLSFSPLSVSVSDNIKAVLWRKLAVNCVINPLTVIHRCRNGELLNSPERRAQMRQVVDEILEVSAALGHADWVADLHKLVTDVATTTAANRSSMLQDVEAGRDTEIDAITGYLCHLAAQHKIAVPMNQQLLDKVKRLSSPHQP